jgi:RNA polymerase sigma-70 factor (ECF subfamily)
MRKTEPPSKAVEERDPYSDKALVEDCQNGNPAAFDELVRRYKDRVYNVVYRFLGNHEDAQDVAQETFIKAYLGIRQFEGRSRVYTWLYSIAGNLARNKIRDGGRRGRDRAVSLEAQREDGRIREWASTAETPEEVARARELAGQLQLALNDLPEHYRLVFVLRTFEKLSYDEIADVVGSPRGTVKSRLNQARKQLHERLSSAAVI